MAGKKDGNKSKQARRAEEWAKQRRGVNWDLVWKVLASVFTFSGSMVAIYELVNYFRSDAGTFYSIIFPGLGIIIWIVILFQLFRKKNPYAILLLSFTILGGVVGGIGLRSYNQTQEDKVIVLVAQFDGPEETYGLRRQVMEDLIDATKDYDDTVIIEGNELVTSSEYARELGIKAKADLVIWAWYRPTENPNITIHFENLSTAQILALKSSEVYEPQATLAELESFDVQQKIGNETKTLIEFIAGIVSYQAGDYQKALSRFEPILLEKDISTYIDPGTLHYKIAESYMELGNYKEAVETYNRLLILNPNDSGAYNNRGVAYGFLQDYNLAIQDFNKAIELEPTFVSAYNNRGSTYGILQDYDRAIQDYDNAIQLDPSFAIAYKNRGVTYLRIGKKAEAGADFVKHTELTIKSP